MILKNLSTLIRRYPATVLLNFVGLVAAYAAFSLIFLQADYELSFDRCHPTAQRVFRADKQADESLFRNILPRGFADDIIAASASIEAGCTVMPFYGETYCSASSSEQGSPVGFKRTLIYASERFIDVFGLQMVEGDSHALEQFGNAIIPRSLAEMLFPNQPAMGQLLKLDKKDAGQNDEVTIAGVYEDFPSNTQLGNDIYCAQGDLAKGIYSNANYVCYVLLRDASNAQAVADEFNGRFDFKPYEGWLSPIELVPLTEIYFRNEGNIYKSGSRSQLWLLIAIAILTLAIGLINFTNFYVALTPLRIRNINLQKILGSSTMRLRLLVVAEAVAWCLCAFALAALLLKPASQSLQAHNVLMQTFALSKHWTLLLLIGAAALITGIAAGIWPSIYSTQGQPALILRGKFGLSASGRNLRAILVGIQFVISTALLIFVLFVQKQSKFMQEYPCGYDKNNLAVVQIGGDNSRNNSNRLREELKQLPEIDDVAFAMELIGGADSYSTTGTNFGKESVYISMMYCTYNLPQVLGLQVIEGRAFTETDLGSLLFTHNLKDYGAELKAYPEKFGTLAPAIGFVNNLNITSLRKASTPVAFLLTPTQQQWVLPYAYIRLNEGANRLEAQEKIQRTLRNIDPTLPFEVQFYDAIGKNLYSGEERLRLAVWLFSILAMLLSMMGVWGQVLMDVQYKKTEIALKRVFGANTEQIRREGLKYYLLKLFISFVVAIPLGWFIANIYLQRFAERVSGFYICTAAIVAMLTVGIICALVVHIQYMHTTKADPAKTLKTE